MMKKILFSCCLLSISLFGVPSWSQDGRSEAPAARTVIDDQIKAFLSGDHDRAYSHAAPSIKTIFPTVEQFIGMVRNGYRPVFEPRTYDFGQSQLAGNKIAQRVNLTGPAGKEWTAIYTLERQADGSWKITGVHLKEVDAPAV